jgi:hypothetical protein
VLIVLELDRLPLNIFFDVFLLLDLEHLLVENMLEALIRVIDAKLLKWIRFKDLKPKDVQ